MTEEPDTRLARLARAGDQELTGLHRGPGASSLLRAVTAEPYETVARPWWRWSARPARTLGLAAAALTVTTAVVVLGPGPLGGATSYANSAIAVDREGEFFVARIKDPLADRTAYREAFDAVGLDVAIDLVPAPPDRIGVLLRTSGGDGTASSELVPTGPEAVDCRREPTACTMVIRISADTGGAVRYTLGRAARPGEQYQDPSVDDGVPDHPRGPGN
ncbi:hypothetical protein [Actinoplanes xinjiangensis]|uniref:hypothetical protein n=1 Tax=Actinoplanes xinjiangensis TaxID=512350 RepID=UPI003415BA1D